MSATAASDLALVVFRLDQQRFALPLPAAGRVVRAVHVTPLPNAPSIVLGAIDVHGEVLPVLNIRRRFGLPDRAISAADWFLIGNTGRRKVVLVIDHAEGVISRPAAEVVPVHDVSPDLEYFSGIVRLSDDLILIQDLDRFLTESEERALNDAIDNRASR